MKERVMKMLKNEKEKKEKKSEMKLQGVDP